MTKKQNSWYWREWGKVTRYCAAHAQPVPDRHSLHIAALGADKSHTAFDDDDIDDVLAAFLAISEPENLDAQVRLANMRRTRRLHAIFARSSKLSPPDRPLAYAESLSRDRFGTLDIEGLELPQLRDLRNTLSSRLKGRPRA